MAKAKSLGLMEPLMKETTLEARSKALASLNGRMVLATWETSMTTTSKARALTSGQTAENTLETGT